VGRELPSGRDTPGSGAPERRSIASQLRDLDKSPGITGPLGMPTGTAQKLGPMLFDPQGADFSLWANHFTREVYRNWIMPPAFEMGVQGMVTIEFTLDRSGRVLSCHVFQPSGFAAYDRAAKNAIESARAQPLPPDYPAETLTIKVGFLYNLRDAPATP
jgi:TonB family protein